MVAYVYNFIIQEVEECKSNVQSYPQNQTLCEAGMDYMKPYLKITNK